MIWRCDLELQNAHYLDRFLEAAQVVLGSGRYVLGAEVKAFENEFAAYCETAHCVSVANGTDAIILGLKSLGLVPGDEVVTTPFTAIPTISAIVGASGRPVFADIDEDTLLLDVDAAADAVTERTRVVMPVHLFTHMFDVERLRGKLPERVRIIEDAAQAHGCRLRGRMAGTLGDLGTYSFYPSKNLGALGDGGAVITADADLAERLRLIRNYGKKSNDLIVCDGVNSRLDELQAAFLRIKLPDLEDGNVRRRALAGIYAEELQGLPITPMRIADDAVPNYHVYVVKVHERRDELRSHLAAASIQTDCFYPEPHHLQPAYAALGYQRGNFPRAEAVGRLVLALPMYPELGPEVVRNICSSIRTFYRRPR
jgi:dTDP-3-amino-3,4,6-trideoxy-alpha-D-glucose transaminase